MGQLDEADLAREQALDHAPLVRTDTPDFQLDWIADSDSRFGPVCEIITAGHYRWLPMSDIAAWQVEQPATLLDLIWAPCALTLTDNSTVRGFMPARYPGLEDAPDRQGEGDALLLGRKTVWQEAGRTAIVGRGQKTWATSAGELGVFELASCRFGDGDGATQREAAQRGAAHVVA